MVTSTGPNPTVKKTSRMAKGILIVMTIGAVVFLAFQAYVYSEKPEFGRDVWGDDEHDVVISNNRFSLNLYKQIYQNSPDKNAFFSPLSISTALVMTALGARGETEKQMLNTLSLDRQVSREILHGAFKFLLRELTSEGNEAYVFRLANKIYMQKDYKILESFKTSTIHFYNSQSENVDFRANVEESRKIINNWVDGATESKIKELLKPGILDTMTRVVLVNAIYFKGNWQQKFSEEATQQQEFHISEDTKVTVDMMYQKGNFRNGYSKELEAEILELPYMGDDLMMTLILPSSRNGLSSVEHKLTYDIMSIMPTTLHNSSIDVYIPKFSLRCEYNLVEILTQMGMKDLFVSEVADLSGITGTRDLHISHVMHQAFIDVNENGSEAAAATAVVANERSMTRRFRADHPFVFYITDKKTRSIIFLGRYVSPTVPATNAPRVDL